MKAIIVLFNANYTVTGEEAITQDIADSLYENTTLEAANEQTIRIHTLDDKEVASLFVKPFLTVDTKQSPEQDSFKNLFDKFCKIIKDRCGTSGTTEEEKTAFKRNFVKLIMEETSLRQSQCVPFLVSNKKLTNDYVLILKKYNIEPIREYLKEINNLLHYF